MDLMTVDVKVGCILKEYILATTGYDMLVPQKDSVLWGLLKQYLVTSSVGYMRIDDRSEYIRIALRRTDSIKTYSISTDKELSLNTLFRNYLTVKGQNVIKLHLEKAFKKTFRDYMTGALNNNSDKKIKEVIGEFCKDKNIPLTHISYEMLRKDWYRFTISNERLCQLAF